jgi:hypothetical protein
VRRYAGDIASFMQFLLVNFLNECAVVLCAAIIPRDSGFRAVTGQASLSRPLIYLQFKSKQDLFWALYVDFVEDAPFPNDL